MISLDHRVAAGQQFNLLQISVVVGVWFLGPRIHISGSHQPSGDLGPSPCPLWSFRGPAAARTRSRPRHCRSLWVGTIIIIQMSGSQIIKLRKMCGHWAMITWVPRRPRRPPRHAAVCSVQVSSSAWRQMEYSVKYDSHPDVKWAADHAT